MPIINLKSTLILATTLTVTTAGMLGSYAFANYINDRNQVLVQAEQANNKSNLVDLVSNTPDLSTLKTAVVAANLSDSLKNGNFTVFAPTNGAFSKLPSETLNSLLKPENKQQLVNILSYHVIEGKVSFADLKTKTSVKTLLNQDVKVKVVGEDIFLNDMVKITTSDVEASNGVAHIIDSVLIPKAGSDNTSVQASPNQASVPTLSQAINSTPELSTLKELVTIAGIDANTLNNITVFAPTNDAFGKLPASLVSYLKHNPAVLKEVILNHILSQKLDSQSVLQFLASSEEPVTNLQNQLLSLSIKNQQIYVNSSKVVATDINTTNGLVHLVDKVIL